MEAYAARLKDLETKFSDMDGGLTPANSAEMEATLRATERLVSDLQDDTEELEGSSILKSCCHFLVLHHLLWGGEYEFEMRHSVPVDIRRTASFSEISEEVSD